MNICLRFLRLSMFPWCKDSPFGLQNPLARPKTIIAVSSYLMLCSRLQLNCLNNLN